MAYAGADPGAVSGDLTNALGEPVTKKEADVSTPSSAYTAMHPYWMMAETLLGGTRALRARRKDYLPQHEQESDRNYENRLQRATLLNMFESTLDTLSGKPFGEAIVVNDDVPEPIAELILSDVDLQGTAVQPFCQEWFRMGWAKGLAHVLVDQGVAEKKFDADGKERPRTLEDDRADGLHPYWVLIRPENLLAAYERVVNGQRHLTHVRILEKTVERQGFEEVEVQKIRVLEPGIWQLWKMDTDGKKWVIENEGTTSLDYIPLSSFYAGKREGLMLCKPPLEDLAHLNIAHWQSSADQRNVLTVARFPILAGKGVDADSKVTIGPNNYLTTTEAGEWYYVEHTGAAIEAGRKDLEALENQMASYGDEFLRQRTGDETATARALDAASANSYLCMTALRFEDCVAQVLQFTADWMGLDEGGTVSLGDFDDEPAGADAPSLQALKDARAARDLSRENYLLELKRRSVLVDTFDLEANQEQLDQEAPSDGLSGMFGDNKDPAGKSKVDATPPGGAK
jgi:hypothetical protein